jgi:hypothetical protein
MQTDAAFSQNAVEPLNQFFSLDGRIGLLYGASSLTRFALYGVTRAVIANHDAWVVDSANSFDAYFVARLARDWNYAPEALLARC